MRMKFQLPWSLSWEDFNFNANVGNLLRPFFKIKIKYDWEFRLRSRGLLQQKQEYGFIPQTTEREWTGAGMGWEEKMRRSSERS